MFPELKQIALANDLAVVSDEGQVYLNNNAWIMALYALEEYRDWACRMAHPLLAPLARQAFAAISRNRYAISRWLSAGGPEEIANELRRVPLAPCAAPHPTISARKLRGRRPCRRCAAMAETGGRGDAGARRSVRPWRRPRPK